MVCPDFLFASPTGALDLERKMLLADLDTTTKQRGWSAAFTRVDAAFLARLIESTLQVPSNPKYFSHTARKPFTFSNRKAS